MKIQIAYQWVPMAKPIKGDAVIEVPDNLGGCRSLEDYILNNPEVICQQIAAKKNRPEPYGNIWAQLETGYAHLRPL